MMVSAKTYILSKLEDIAKDISSLKILYKYDPLSKEHLIKVYPLEEYTNNSRYQDIEANIIFDFIKKYPHDSLVFFSENDWIDIANPDKIISGNNYQFENSVSFNSMELLLFQNPEDDLLNIEVGVLNDEYSKIDLINIEKDLPIKSLEGSFYELLRNSQQCKLTNNLDDDQIEDGLIDCNLYSHDEYCSCNNYALAA